MRSSTSARSLRDVQDEQLSRPPAVGRQTVEVLAEDRCLGDERRDRRPKLVSDVGDEPAVLCLGGLEPADRARLDVGHLIEPSRPLTELVIGRRPARAP